MTDREEQLRNDLLDHLEEEYLRDNLRYVSDEKPHRK